MKLPDGWFTLTDAKGLTHVASPEGYEASGGQAECWWGGPGRDVWVGAGDRDCMWCREIVSREFHAQKVGGGS